MRLWNKKLLYRENFHETLATFEIKRIRGDEKQDVSISGICALYFQFFFGTFKLHNVSVKLENFLCCHSWSSPYLLTLEFIINSTAILDLDGSFLEDSFRMWVTDWKRSMFLSLRKTINNFWVYLHWNYFIQKFNTYTQPADHSHN